MWATFVQLFGKGNEGAVIPSGFHFDNIHNNQMLKGYKNSVFLLAAVMNEVR